MLCTPGRAAVMPATLHTPPLSWSAILLFARDGNTPAVLCISIFQLLHHESLFCAASTWQNTCPYPLLHSLLSKHRHSLMRWGGGRGFDGLLINFPNRSLVLNTYQALDKDVWAVSREPGVIMAVFSSMLAYIIISDQRYGSCTPCISGQSLSSDCCSDF